MNIVGRYAWILFSLASLYCLEVKSNRPVFAETGIAEHDSKPFALQQWVRISDGCLRGVLNRPWTSFDSVADVQVRVISITDSTVQRTLASADGRFEVIGLEPGPHVFVASGNGYYASFALHLVDNPGPSVADMIDVPLAGISSSVMREFARKHIPAKLAGSEPARPLFSEGTIPSNTTQRGQPAIQLGARGSFSGQLWIPSVGQRPRTPASGMSVAIYLGERALATTKCDDDGEFTLRGLSPGVYTFSAAGENGFLTFGVELLEAGSKVELVQKVSTRRTWSQNSEVRRNEFLRKICPTLNCEVFPLWEVVGLNDII